MMSRSATTASSKRSPRCARRSAIRRAACPISKRWHGAATVFLAPVERKQAPKAPIAFDAVLHPHRIFIDGRAALETLDRDEVARARQAFAEALRAAPDLVAAHIGIANACVLQFEGSRVDAAPDLAALRE